jgi:hypothetical protein
MEWRADPPADDDFVPQARVLGTRIRMMPEYGVEFPLWDHDGPLEERALLKAVLRLSPSLIDDLARWQAEWDDVNSVALSDDTGPVRPLPPSWRRDHRDRGRELFARLQREVDPGFEVRFHA